MDFHKHYRDTVLGIGCLCLIWNLSMLSFNIIGNWAVGLWLGIFIVGVALYKDDKKD